MDPLFIHLLKSSSILLVFLLSYHLFLKKETFFSGNRLFLLAGLIIALLLPFVIITKTIIVEPVPLVQGYQYLVEQPISTTSAHSLLSWKTILAIIYFAGVLLFSTKLVIQLKTIKKIKKNSEVVENKSFFHVRTKKNISPFSFFRHIFYYPNQFPEEELDTIIAHEEVHARELHSIDILLTQMLLIVLWFNPVIWFYKTIIKQNLEFLADAKTCEADENKKFYQYLMLKQAIGNHQISIANPFYNSIIKKRIVMLNQSQSKSINRLKLLVVLPFLGIFLFGFNTKEVVKFAENPVSSNTNKEDMPDSTSPETQLDPANFIPFTSTKTDKKTGQEKKTSFSSSIKTIKLSIDKNTTDASLAKMKDDLAQEGADFSYTVVRNSSKEIIDISIQINGEGTNGEKFNGSYNTSSDSPINPITILYDDESNAVSFWNSNSTVSAADNESIIWVDSDEDESKRIVIKTINGKKTITVDGKEVDEDELEEMNIFRIKEGKSNNMKFIIDSESKEEGNGGVFIFENDDNDDTKKTKIKIRRGQTNKSDKPIIIVNGEEVDEKEISNLPSENIKTVHVLKGTSAKEKYGKKGEDGVIEIITKDKKQIVLRNNSDGLQIEKDDNVFIIDTNEAGDFSNDIKFVTKGKKPLFVVDGKKVKKLKDTNPDNIESVNVLKGKAAEEKYGRKGKNGVVEITTKKKN
ncbi:M56 family metallopeptidase [Croceitalea marina]|uniref:M56 family metallopeptidase n=1 Tax=Croceitalea marina TaxID=1775166 RepID=A0ABW5MW85_9FLAO